MCSETPGCVGYEIYDDNLNGDVYKCAILGPTRMGNSTPALASRWQYEVNQGKGGIEGVGHNSNYNCFNKTFRAAEGNHASCRQSYTRNSIKHGLNVCLLPRDDLSFSPNCSISCEHSVSLADMDNHMHSHCVVCSFYHSLGGDHTQQAHQPS